MSTILYYSNYCNNCKHILSFLSKTTTVKSDIHFLCIDNREKKNNGMTYIKLANGEEVLLPPTITKVPALLLINRGYHVLFGDEILKHIQPPAEAMKQQSVSHHGEPSAFALGLGRYGVASDHYSFLDQTPDELLAKGEGGMRQSHHYANIVHADKIETPPDTYSADTIGNVSLDNLQEQRANAIK